MSLKGSGGDHEEMLVTLQTRGLQTLEQIRAFLDGSEARAALFQAIDRDQTPAA